MGKTSDVANEWWRLFLSGQLDRLGEVTADDVEFRGPGVALRGRDALKPFLGGWLEAFSGWKHEVVSTVEAGDRLVVELKLTAKHTGAMVTPQGTVPPTGRTVVWESCDHVQVRDGKIVLWHAYWDRAAMAAQLGLVPGGA